MPSNQYYTGLRSDAMLPMNTRDQFSLVGDLPLDVTSICNDGVWIGYSVENGLAWPLTEGDLEHCREYAKQEGFAGICVGSPSVPWGSPLK
jgi:hypothetical protein